MLKFLAADSLTWDVETIPDVAAGRRLHALRPDECTDDEVRHLMWAHAGATPENPTPFLKPILQQVVSIACVWRSEMSPGKAGVTLRVLEGDEASQIRKFMRVVGEKKPQLVGFNSEGFDLPLLVQRALVHGLSVPEFCKRPGKPWEGIDYHAKYSDYHVDLMHELGGFGRSMPSLSEACAAMGILGGAKDVSGADVLDLYLAGELAAIHRYCAKDAVRHFLLLLRLCVLAGHVSAEEAAREEADVVAQLDALTAPVAAMEPA